MITRTGPTAASRGCRALRDMQVARNGSIEDEFLLALALNCEGADGDEPPSFVLVEDVRRMADMAAQATDNDGVAMPNTRCRDVALLLFMFHSAMRRNEVANLLWNDMTSRSAAL